MWTLCTSRMTYTWCWAHGMVVFVEHMRCAVKRYCSGDSVRGRLSTSRFLFLHHRTTAREGEKTFNVARLCEKINTHLVMICGKITHGCGAYNGSLVTLGGKC